MSDTVRDSSSKGWFWAFVGGLAALILGAGWFLSPWGGGISPALLLAVIGVVLTPVAGIVVLLRSGNGRSAVSVGALPDGTYRVRALGRESGPMSRDAVLEAFSAGTLLPATPVQLDDGDWFEARELGGLFAPVGSRSFTTAIVLSVLFGGLGVDRFYLGYTGLGIVKLVTCGGCGVWSLIDLILIATGRLRAADGTALARDQRA